MQWNTRIAEIDPDHPNERVYFFKKAFKDYIASGSQNELLSSMEKELGICHYSGLAEIIKQSPSSNANSDSLFSCSKMETMLDEMEDATANFKYSQPYLDLCLLLGEKERAEKLIKEKSIMHDALSCDGKDLRDVASRILVEATINEADAAHLTSLVYRASVDPAARKLIISELWFFGYHWDAYCISKTLFPNQRISNELQKRISNLIKPKVTHQAKLVAYCEKNIEDTDPIQLYRILKLDIIRNERSKASELEQIELRGALSNALRRVILSALIKLDKTDAIQVANDAAELLKNNYREAVSEYLPSAEKVIFEQSIGMLSDMLRAIQNILNGKKISNRQDNIIAKLKEVWKERLTEFWTNELQRAAFVKVCNSLTSHLTEIEKYFSAFASKVASVKCALAVASLIASIPLPSDELDKRITETIFSSGFSEENGKILLSFLTKTQFAISDKEQKKLPFASSFPSSANDWPHCNNIHGIDCVDAAPQENLASRAVKACHDNTATPENFLETNEVAQNGNNSPDSDSSLLGSANDLNKNSSNSSGLSKEAPLENPKITENASNPSIVPVPNNTTLPPFRYGGFEELEDQPCTFGIRPSREGFTRTASLRGRGGSMRGRGTSDRGGGRMVRGHFV